MVKYSPLQPSYASNNPMLLLLACVMVLFIFSITPPLNLENTRQDEVNTLSSIIKTSENNFNWKKWLEKNNIDWLLPIYQQVTSEIWIYHCLGILIHAKAILTAEECIRPYKSYATGFFKWKENYNATVLDNNKLFRITSTKARLSYRLTTFGYLNENNVKWIGKNTVSGIIIMSIDEPINFIKPVDISESLTLNDIYDANFVRECIHIIFPEVAESGVHVPKQIQETIMTRSELFNRFNKTYNYLYNLNKNVSIEFNYEANVFGTFDKLNLKSYDTQRGLLGSPMLCRPRDDSSLPYSLVGLLTSQIHDDWYEYSGINQKKAWINEKLFYIK